jgi:hypothetical protein
LTPYLKLSVSIWGTLLLLTIFLHIIANHLGFWLKLTRSKW